MLKDHVLPLPGLALETVVTCGSLMCGDGWRWVESAHCERPQGLLRHAPPQLLSTFWVVLHGVKQCETATRSTSVQASSCFLPHLTSCFSSFLIFFQVFCIFCTQIEETIGTVWLLMSGTPHLCRNTWAVGHDAWSWPNHHFSQPWHLTVFYNWIQLAHPSLIDSRTSGSASGATTLTESFHLLMCPKGIRIPSRYRPIRPPKRTQEHKEFWTVFFFAMNILSYSIYRFSSLLKQMFGAQGIPGSWNGVLAMENIGEALVVAKCSNGLGMEAPCHVSWATLGSRGELIFDEGALEFAWRKVCAATAPCLMAMWISWDLMGSNGHILKEETKRPALRIMICSDMQSLTSQLRTSHVNFFKISQPDRRHEAWKENVENALGKWWCFWGASCLMFFDLLQTLNRREKQANCLSYKQATQCWFKGMQWQPMAFPFALPSGVFEAIRSNLTLDGPTARITLHILRSQYSRAFRQHTRQSKV